MYCNRVEIDTELMECIICYCVLLSSYKMWTNGFRIKSLLIFWIIFISHIIHQWKKHCAFPSQKCIGSLDVLETNSQFYIVNRSTKLYMLPYQCFCWKNVINDILFYGNHGDRCSLVITGVIIQERPHS